MEKNLYYVDGHRAREQDLLGYALIQPLRIPDYESCLEVPGRGFSDYGSAIEYFGVEYR